MSAFTTASSITAVQNSGNTSSVLRVGTLNITGTFKNPLEYLSSNSDDAVTRVNNVFASDVKTRFQENEQAIKQFYDMVNVLDKDVNTSIYSPRYNKNIVVEDISEEEFGERWNDAFDSLSDKELRVISKVLSKELNKLHKISELTKEQLDEFCNDVTDSLRLFDWLAYRAIFQTGVTNAELHARLVPNNVKVQSIEKVLREKNLDVLFLQEMFEFSYIPEGYHLEQATLGEGCTELTGILLKNELQGVPLSSFYSKTALHETFFGYVVGNTVFVSVHLNSKNRKKAGMINVDGVETQNPKNYEDQKTELDEFLVKLKLQGFNVVCGMDANHAVDYSSLDFNAFPNKQSPVYTTSKMRGDIQAQYGKRRDWAKECRDAIVSTGGMENTQVRDLEGNLVDGEDVPTLPSMGHSFDHLLVVATVYL